MIRPADDERSAVAPQLNRVCAARKSCEGAARGLMAIARRTFLASSAAAIAAPAVLRVVRADAPQIAFKLHHFIRRCRARTTSSSCLGRARSGGFRRPHPHRHLSLDAAWRRAGASVRPGARWRRRYRVDGAGADAGAVSEDRSCSICRFCRRAARWSHRRRSQDFAALNLKDEFREIHPICFSCARSRRHPRQCADPHRRRTSRT